MPHLFEGSRNRLRKAVLEMGGLFGFLLLAVSFVDWLQDSLAAG